MTSAESTRVAEAMVAPGRGILAADEYPPAPIKKRFTNADGAESSADSGPRLSRVHVPLDRR